ncbi:MAG: DUF192 domain-containing protein [Patescibacteria group bacterium]
MYVFNKTKNCLISDKVEVAKTFKEKSEGLLKYETSHAMYFETRWGIHTYGMKFPIDVIVLDEDNTAKKIKKDMKPGRFFFWNPKYKRVLELPIGSDVEENDVLETV